MVRAILLLLAVLSFGTAGYAYYTAVRRTPGADGAERIVTWGPAARGTAWSADMMRWGSGVGLVLFLAWAWLSAGG